MSELVRSYALPPYLLQVLTTCGVDANKFLEAIDAVRADALERRWQPIESAPKSGGAILVYQPWKSGYDTVMIGHYANGWVWQDASKDGEMWDIHPTHWMPLPPPPAKRD